MADREQTRRDAEWLRNVSLAPAGNLHEIADRIDALLAELEQAERERDDRQRQLTDEQDRLLKAGWRIVPSQSDLDREVRARALAEREAAAYKETLDNVAEDAAARVQQAEQERDEAIAACVGDIELEQTRRERDEAQEEADQLDNRLDLANLRLAKVDALVEKVRETIAELRVRASETNAIGQIVPPYTAASVNHLANELAAGLTVWEQDQ